MKREHEALLSWGRYLHWSDILRRLLNEHFERDEQEPDESGGGEFFARMSLWYAAEWVVIEGWRELGFRDHVIEALLDRHPDYCELLKRYRNGVFHFQPRLIEERFLGFMREGNGAGEWMAALHEEFQRFFWEWPYRLKGTDAEIEEVRAGIEQLVGWMPHDCAVAHVHRLERLADEAERELRDADDHESAAARELLAAAEHCRNVAKDARRQLVAKQQKYLE